MSTVRKSAATRLPFWLDTALLVLFVVLRAPRSTGLTLHEILGIAFIAPMVVHLLLSWRWMVTALRRAFSPARRRDTVNLLLNVALFVTATGAIVSGVMISQAALPWLGIATIDDRLWRETHNNWTDLMLFSVATHVAMNLRWIARAVDPYLPGWMKEAL